MKVADIEGIGPVYSQRLAAGGVTSVQGLLISGATRKGRAELAAMCGLTEQQVLAWVNRADLYRVKGIGSEYSDLLEQAGVDTVVELAQRNPANLTDAFEKLVNGGTSVVRRVPSQKVVTDWIEQAKKLPRAVAY